MSDLKAFRLVHGHCGFYSEVWGTTEPESRVYLVDIAGKPIHPSVFKDMKERLGVSG